MTKEENEKRLAYLKGIVSRLPEKPGSYQYYDEHHTIIYVGKAKNLKARVSSYFHTEVDRFKTKVLVSKIHDISYTVVNTEEDALLLENSLIKKYNPRYNVLLPYDQQEMGHLLWALLPCRKYVRSSQSDQGTLSSSHM